MILRTFAPPARIRPSLALAASIAALALVRPAAAEPNPADVAAARALAIEGIQLADAGDCKSAIDRLERASKLHWAPTILGRLGECHVSLGRLVLGTEILQRVVREPLEKGAPPAFHDAVARAQKTLDAALPRIGKLRVTVVRPAGVKPSVKVDGEPLSEALLDANRPTDPGTHTVEATADGHLPAKATVTLAEGATQSVSLTLKPDAASAAPPPARSATPATPPPSEERKPGPSGAGKTAGYVLLGLGAGGLVAGTVFGLLAKGKKSDLDAACSADKVCPPAQQGTLDDMKRFGTFSTVGFGVGAVSAAIGAVLLVTSRDPEGSAAATPRVRPFVGVGSAGVLGAF